jgi:predicted transcriptional regulator
MQGDAAAAAAVVAQRRLKNVYNPIVQALVRFSVQDLLLGAPGKLAALITIRADDSLEQCLRVLSQRNILSLPVLDDRDVVVGNIDLLDVMTFCMRIQSPFLCFISCKSIAFQSVTFL